MDNPGPSRQEIRRKELVFREGRRQHAGIPCTLNEMLKRNHLELGSESRLKGFDYFRANLFARFFTKAYGSDVEDNWDGYLFNIACGRPLYTFPYHLQLHFDGWLDFVFGSDKSEARKDQEGNRIGTSHSVQWFNQLRIQKGHFAVSYSFEFNNNFTEIGKASWNSSDSNAHIIGIHYVF